MNANRKAFLDMIAFSEGTSSIKGSDNGYNVIVGGKLFASYSDHPRVLVNLPKLGIKSTAAGRYQVLKKYYDHYKAQLGLKDFSPASQDAIAIQLIKECNALADIDAGRIKEAIAKCRSRWASLPGAGYGQHEHSTETLLAKYDGALQANSSLA
jgi:muramidase (phage lysozyme)